MLIMGFHIKKFYYLLPAIIFILVIAIYLLPPKTSQSVNVQTEKNFCTQVSTSSKEVCYESLEKCSNAPREAGFWSCVALNLLRINLEDARLACGQINDFNGQKLCLADIMSEINITSAEEECNLIQDFNGRIFCHSTIWKRRDSDLAFEKCKSITDEDIANNCMALALVVKNKESAKEYCEKIADPEKRKSCLDAL